MTRLQVQTAVFSVAGLRLDLLPWLRQQATQPLATVDVPVTFGVAERLPGRVLAIRVPPPVGEARRRALRADARRRGQMVSQDRLARADWTLFATNVPGDLLTLHEALSLARARWQIELLFKLWKSHGHLDTSRSQQDARRLCEVFATLLALLIQHWFLVVACWRFPDRSLVCAAQAVRSSAPTLASGLRSPARLTAAIQTLINMLALGPRINRRRQRPTTWQLLLDLQPPTLDQAPLNAVA